MVSRVDQIYRSILLSKFFVRGWGKPENLRRIFAFRKILSNREKCQHLVDKNHPVTVTKETDNGDHILLEAEFVSPFVEQLPGLLPKESEKATFQFVYPKTWRTHLRPTCLHLAGTGDHGYWRRRMLMAKPLLEESGIASIMLENPFYGIRKPKDQLRSSLHNVSDLFVMGGCLVLESLAIFHWCERMGFGPLGITGHNLWVDIDDTRSNSPRCTTEEEDQTIRTTWLFESIHKSGVWKLMDVRPGRFTGYTYLEILDKFLPLYGLADGIFGSYQLAYKPLPVIPAYPGVQLRMFPQMALRCHRLAQTPGCCALSLVYDCLSLLHARYLVHDGLDAIYSCACMGQV
ncbi:protein ABHD18-like [Penaeus indicus]|uniref:protein ABHD18-like n=1 Tax=Penaeus indicus TaxID=29960 RepID=UPI00300C8DA2